MIFRDGSGQVIMELTTDGTYALVTPAGRRLPLQQLLAMFERLIDAENAANGQKDARK